MNISLFCHSPFHKYASSLFTATSLMCVLCFTSVLSVHAEERTLSPGGKTYHISPTGGSDAGDGSKQSPWKTFAPLNKLTLSPGDSVEVVTPGDLTETLNLAGGGTEKNPVTIKFASGRYDWWPDKLLTRKLAISNTNDVPQGDKAIAMELSHVKNLRINGPGALFFCRGKMTTVHLDHASNIVFNGIGFDYHRPTISEYKAEEVNDKDAVISIHKDSAYALENGKVVWIGEGWKAQAGGYGQTFRENPVTLLRSGTPLGDIERAEELSPGKLKVTFSQNPGFEKGVTYQNRETQRDYSGVFCNRSENIAWNDVKFHYIHGMGVVSQFSKNISFKKLTFAPRKDSGRTCAAWADMLHFSGCGGKILVDGVHFYGANDDPINIHGTYLRITEIISPKEIKVSFLHPQTYGFEAFTAGDEIEFVNNETLLPYGKSKVTQAKLVNDKEMILQLSNPVPAAYKKDDAIENITWTPAVHIKNCTVDAIPTRGFLLSTRKPVIVENCTFNRTGMSAILVAADVNSWFESGPAHNMTIRNNKFIECAEPVICFHPENAKGDEKAPLHSGIKISNNTFDLKGQSAVSLKSVGNVKLSRNTFLHPKTDKTLTLQDLVSRQYSPPFQSEKDTIKEK